MGIKEFVEKHLIFRKNKALLAENITEQVKQTYQDVKENEDHKVATEVATETAYELYEAWRKRVKPEERGEFVQKLATELVEKKGIPYDVAADFITKMIDDENVPNKYVIEPAMGLPSEKISDVVENENISIEHKEVLVSSMEDEEIREEATRKIEQEIEEKRIRKEKEIKQKKLNELKQLVRIYSGCDFEKSDYDIIHELQGFDNSKQYNTVEEEKIRQRIIAKKIACNYAKYGTTRISKLSEYMTATEMKQIDMLELVQKEYEKIIKRQKDKEIKIFEYDKENLKRQIIENSVKEEQNKVECDQENKIEQKIKDIREELRALSPEVRKNEINIFEERIGNEKRRNTYNMIEASGLIEKLQSLSLEDAEKVLKGTVQVIENRTKKKETNLEVNEEYVEEEEK